MVVSPFQEGDPDETTQKDKRTTLNKTTKENAQNHNTF